MTKITIELLEKYNLLDSVVIKKIEGNTINFTDEIESDMYNKIVDAKRIKRFSATNKISSYLRRIDFKYKNQGEREAKKFLNQLKRISNKELKEQEKLNRKNNNK